MPLAASHISIMEIIDSSERGMNPVTITILNPWKEYWPSLGSNQPTPVHDKVTITIFWLPSASAFPAMQTV